MIPTQTNPPPQPGHADTLKPSSDEAADQLSQRLQDTANGGEPVHASDLKENADEILSQKEMQSQDAVDGPDTQAKTQDSGNSESKTEHDDVAEDRGSDIALDAFEPKPPKVRMDDPNATPWELRAQIQLYATTEYVLF